MKQPGVLQSFLLILFLVACVDNSDHTETTRILTEMKSPVIVVTSYGNEFFTDLIVKDSTGRIEVLHDNSLHSLHRGDTIK